MIIKDGRIDQDFIWYELPFYRRTICSQRESEIIKNVKFYLRKSVHSQMVSDVPLGAFLSGGLDSSSIVAFAKEKDPNIQCFTIDTSELESEGVINDLPYAKEVAKHLNLPLEIIPIDPKKILSMLI